MIVRNTSRNTVIGEAIEVAESASQKIKGLLGRDGLDDGHGLLFRGAGSLHTLFMRFPIDIIYTDKQGNVTKVARAVRPFKLVGAPLRCHYAIELPVGAIESSKTEVGDALSFDGDPELLEAAS